MANNILIQWQSVSQAVAAIQSQLNALSASVLPAVSTAAAGEFAVINAAGTGYVLVRLSGDAISGSVPGQVTILGVNGNPVSSQDPTPGQIWIWNGTMFVPTSISGDGSISAAGVLTLTAFGGVTPNFMAGPGISITGTFPAYTISATSGPGTAFTNLSTITNAPTSGAVQAVTIQLKDSGGNNIAAVQAIMVYMATDALGAVPSVNGVYKSVTVTTGMAIPINESQVLVFNLVTNASGTLTLSFDNTGAPGQYTDRVVLILPTGQVLVGSPLSIGSTAFTPTPLNLPVLPPSQWRTPFMMGH